MDCEIYLVIIIYNRQVMHVAVMNHEIEACLQTFFYGKYIYDIDRIKPN